MKNDLAEKAKKTESWFYELAEAYWKAVCPGKVRVYPIPGCEIVKVKKVLNEKDKT